MWFESSRRRRLNAAPPLSPPRPPPHTQTCACFCRFQSAGTDGPGGSLQVRGRRGSSLDSTTRMAFLLECSSAAEQENWKVCIEREAAAGRSRGGRGSVAMLTTVGEGEKEEKREDEKMADVEEDEVAPEFEEDPVQALRAKRETFLTGTSSDSEMKAFLQWKDLR